ncbi:MAG: glycosyltransferase family 9 protein [Anaerolineae bacterium]
MPDQRTQAPAAPLSLPHRVRRIGLAGTARALHRVSGRHALAEGGRLRVLLIRPDHLGDVLLMTPALAALRATWPAAHVTCLVGPWSEAVVRRNPHVDTVLTLPFPGFTRQAKPNAWDPYALAWREAQRLRGRFDIALVLRFDHWWGALVAALAGIPLRVGYDVPDVAPLLTTRVPYAADTHATALNLALVEALTGRPLPPDPTLWPLEFPVTAAERADAEAWLAARGVGPRERLVAIHPGAGADVKLWAGESWSQVADTLADEGARILLTGSAGEAHLTAEVQARMRHAAIDAAGGTPLPRLAALLERCSLVLGPDAGILHLATAVGTPTVRLYGPIDPRKFGPWGDPARHRVVLAQPPLACQFCDRLDYPAADLPLHPCVRWITVAQTLAAASAVQQTGI